MGSCGTPMAVQASGNLMLFLDCGRTRSRRFRNSCLGTTNPSPAPRPLSWVGHWCQLTSHLSHQRIYEARQASHIMEYG